MLADARSAIVGVWQNVGAGGYSEGISFLDDGEYRLAWTHCPPRRGGGHCLEMIEPTGVWSTSGVLIIVNHRDRLIEYEILKLRPSKLKLRDKKTNETKTLRRVR